MVVVLLSGLLLARHYGLGPFPAPPRPVAVVDAAASADGTVLRLGVFYGCQRFGSAAVNETSREVRVLVKLRHLDGPCTLASVHGTVAVRLRSPLGGRIIRDASTGDRARLVDGPSLWSLPPVPGDPGQPSRPGYR